MKMIFSQIIPACQVKVETQVLKRASRERRGSKGLFGLECSGWAKPGREREEHEKRHKRMSTLMDRESEGHPQVQVKQERVYPSLDISEPVCPQFIK